MSSDFFTSYVSFPDVKKKYVANCYGCRVTRPMLFSSEILMIDSKNDNAVLKSFHNNGPKSTIKFLNVNAHLKFSQSIYFSSSPREVTTCV